MASHWEMLEYAVGIELALAFTLLFPWSKDIQTEVLGVVGFVLKPLLGIIPFSAFKLLELYRKSEFRLRCGGDNCADKSIQDAEAHTDLCFSSCLLYWGVYRIWKCLKKIESMEAQKIDQG